MMIVLDTEVARRNAEANSAVARLYKGKIWWSTAVSFTTKLQFLQTFVTIMYDCQICFLHDGSSMDDKFG